MLAAKLLQEQGLSVLCLHYYTPFFGSPAKARRWGEIYDLDIEACDASIPFMEMLANWPGRGFGKNLNPCVDCKIVLLKLAREKLAQCGARVIATGEVLGQRPMSQRTEALNAISKESGAKDFLLRPLCAQHLPPTSAESEGLIDRSRLLAISGRGRNEQLELARRMNISEIPSPAGGCRLTEHENMRRYWPILQNFYENPYDLERLAANFRLTNHGRILFSPDSRFFLCVGRNESGNAKIKAERLRDDILLTLPFPGPLALLRGDNPPPEIARQAAAILASFSQRALSAGSINILARQGDSRFNIETIPNRMESAWRLPAWEETQAELKAERKRRQEEALDKRGAR